MLPMFKELARLFATPARIKLVKFFVLQPHAKVTLSEINSVVGITKKQAEQELRALIRAGVVLSKVQGKKKTYSLSLGYPHAAALEVFLTDTTWPGERTISDAFRGVPGIALLVVTGALLRDARPSIDLLVVTRRPSDVRIKQAVRKVEISASFPLRYTVLEVGDYHERRMAHDRLLRDVFEYSHQIIVGKP